MPLVCALVGATGVGKTELALALAERLRAEIISCDSCQVYKGFSIGTSQPSAEDLARVPHHLVNFLSPERRYSAGTFCGDVKKLLTANLNTNYILVGGTGLYLQALTEGLADIPPVEDKIRETFAARLASGGLPALYREALQVDPAAGEFLLPQDSQRILRTLELYAQTGSRFSDLRKMRRGGIGQVKTFWLSRERTKLYSLIDGRVLKMVRDGWPEEVRLLRKSVPPDASAWQSLGYKEWVECLNGEKTQKEVISFVQQATRRYAKRQITWFRHQIAAEILDAEAPQDLKINKICAILSA